MSVISRKYSDHVIVLLVGVIVVLLFVLVTDVHVAKINRQIDKTIHQPF